jgi:hypothetical protein
MEHFNLLLRDNLQVGDSVPEAVFERFSQLGRMGSAEIRNPIPRTNLTIPKDRNPPR